jgi:hypothetical protein
MLVMDESGSKGYDDNQEQQEGEFGVMAGFALPESKAGHFITGLTRIVDSFESDGKLHITDLLPSEQEQLRQRLFEYFSQCRVRWFYEATYVQGFYEAHGYVKALAKEAKEARRSNVKLSLNPSKESLHGELFLGAFTSGLALAIDHTGPKCHIRVVTDRVDEPVLELFKAEADRFLRAREPDCTGVTGFDTERKEVVRGAVETSVVAGLSALGDVSGITYEIECTDDVLTLAADILVNSVRHYLSQIQGATPGSALNTPKAISGHPLQHLVYGAPACATSVNVADTIFRHPQSRLDASANDG